MGRADDIMKDLLKICLAQNSENVCSAARCMGQLAVYTTSDITQMQSLANKCFQAIKLISSHNPAHGDLHPSQVAKVQRSIVYATKLNML